MCVNSLPNRELPSPDERLNTSVPISPCT
uniref:Uncharacterized protein n=1 Tax=Arundo donax TaxID=35708 RepID=A0A0A9HHG1_ARUDO